MDQSKRVPDHETMQLMNTLYYLSRLERDTWPAAIVLGITITFGVLLGGGAYDFAISLGCVLALIILCVSSLLQKLVHNKLKTLI